MSRKSIIYLCATVLLAAYTVTAVAQSRARAAAEPNTAVVIDVADSARSGFVTAADVDKALGGLRARARRTPRRRINTLKIERMLTALPNIEGARCVARNDGTLHLCVVPMQPVARVFDNGSSYYINASGKRIAATAGHHVDVPVVTGHFASGKDVAALLPMFGYIHSHPDLDAMVTSVTVRPNGDIIVIPPVAGHVINLGDTTMIADKFGRLRRFYREVMPVRGWDCYDTLSVKWRGRLVATRAVKRPDVHIALDRLEGIVDEVPDDGTTDTGTAADIEVQADSAAHLR